MYQGEWVCKAFGSDTKDENARGGVRDVPQYVKSLPRMQNTPSSVARISKTEYGAAIPILGLIPCYIRFLRLAWDMRHCFNKQKSRSNNK